MLENFRVEDITFKGARLQSKVAEELGYDKSDTKDSLGLNSGVPQTPIIERAIKYYEDNAKGQFAVLYSATAEWLRTLMSIPKCQQGNKEPESEYEVEEVDLSEVEEED